MTMSSTVPQSPRLSPTSGLITCEAALALNLDQLALEDLSDPAQLRAVHVPFSELWGLMECLSKYHITESSLHSADLSQRLVSLFEFSFAPTSPSNLPIRTDLLLERICQQPVCFLPNLLRNITEWFGLVPNKRLHELWSTVPQGATGELEVPQQVRAWSRVGLAAWGRDSVLVPVVVLAMWRSVTAPPSWDEVVDLLHRLRQALLAGDCGESSKLLYQRITSHLLNANPSLEGHFFRIITSRGELVNLRGFLSALPAVEPVIDAVLVSLQRLYEADGQRYRLLFNRVHGPLWDRLGRARDEIASIGTVKQDSVVLDPTDWAASCRAVSGRLDAIAEAYGVLAEVERALGVDRYLGSKAVVPDLQVMHSQVCAMSAHVQQALTLARELYLRRWNLSQIAPLLLGLLGISPGASTSSIGNYFPRNQTRVIFVLVDGLGYMQFRWFLRTVGRRASHVLTGNIFTWLRDHGLFNETYMLASNLVGVTGSCLPTIFTGALPRDTGIVGTHMLIEGRRLNLIHGSEEQARFPLSHKAMTDICRRNVNTSLISLVDAATGNGVDVQIVHGGQASFPFFTKLLYGRSAGRPQHYRTVSPPDRVFSAAADALSNWEDAPGRERLGVIYYPLIDSSGHPCGPYTQFQAVELARFSFLFAHFLIELVERCGTAFDGKTSVVLTADHGMFESSSQVMSERLIRGALGGLGLENTAIVYDNRACYIYRVPHDRLECARRVLREFFEDRGYSIDVLSRADGLVQDLLCSPIEPYSANCPDLILQFCGPGVFYHKESLAPHMFLYGAHGGCSVDETFVPLVHFVLTPELAAHLKCLY